MALRAASALASGLSAPSILINPWSLFWLLVQDQSKNHCGLWSRTGPGGDFYCLSLGLGSFPYKGLRCGCSRAVGMWGLGAQPPPKELPALSHPTARSPGHSMDCACIPERPRLSPAIPTPFPSWLLSSARLGEPFRGISALFPLLSWVPNSPKAASLQRDCRAPVWIGTLPPGRLPARPSD